MNTLQERLRAMAEDVASDLTWCAEAADRIGVDAERIKVLEAEAAMLRLQRDQANADRLQMQEAQAALEADAERYRWLRHGTAGVRDSRGRMEFDLPDPHPLGNIMQGSVAQHLDAAIDAARSKDSK